MKESRESLSWSRFMRRCLALALAFNAFIGCLTVAIQGASGASGYTGKGSALRIDAGALGGDWTGPTGLVVDDFEDVNGFPPETRQVVEEVKKQVTPHGVVAVADFTYRRKSDPLDQMTLRVFVFASESSCRDWWQKKYRFDGWEKLYSVVDGVPYDALDSKQVTKRAIAFGNVWMTCGNLKGSGEHLKLLSLAMAKVRGASPGAANDPGRP
jgi:hypothetical protein